MPPTVRELQAQQLGYLLGLLTAAPSSPSVLPYLPPADCANSPPVTPFHSIPSACTHMHTYINIHTSIHNPYSTALCLHPLYVETLCTAPVIKWKPMLQCYFWVMPHFTLLAPGIWSSGRLCNWSPRSWLKYYRVCKCFNVAIKSCLWYGVSKAAFSYYYHYHILFSSLISYSC